MTEAAGGKLMPPADIREMAAFLKACYTRESAPGRYALHGNAADLRTMLERFRKGFETAAFVTSNPDDLETLLTTYRLTGRLLKHTNKDLKAALRFSAVHRSDRSRVRDVVLNCAVEHAMYEMGAPRTELEACRLVEIAMGKVVGLLGAELKLLTIKKYSRRAAEDIDPLGPGAR